MLVDRMISIIVKRRQEEKAMFAAAVPTALREYADAVEKGDKSYGDLQEFKASNDCRVLVIAGSSTVS